MLRLGQMKLLAPLATPLFAPISVARGDKEAMPL